MKSGRMNDMGTRIIRRITTVWLEFIVMILHCVGSVPIHHVRRFFYRLAGMKIGCLDIEIVDVVGYLLQGF